MVRQAGKYTEVEVYQPTSTNDDRRADTSARPIAYLAVLLNTAVLGRLVNLIWLGRTSLLSPDDDRMARGMINN